MFNNRDEALQKLEDGYRVIINVFNGGSSYVQKSDGNFYFHIDHNISIDHCSEELIREEVALSLIYNKYPI